MNEHQAVRRYDQRDPAIEARVDDRIARLTPVEKVGRLVQRCIVAAVV